MRRSRFTESEIHVAHSIPGEHVAQVLDRAGRERRLPAAIVCDNGPEFAESFNGTFREECLSEHWFLSLQEAR